MQRQSQVAFNRGILSKLGLARLDIDRLRMAASVQKNWMSRVLGSMMIRPGFKYTGATKSNNRARGVPFIFGDDDYARIELTDSVMRVWIDDALVARPAVTATVTNSGFDSDVSGWTDNDESGGTSSWETGYLKLIGNGTNAAIRRQQVTVNETSTEHALRIVIARGPVQLRVGSSAGDDDYIGETTLGTGTHSLTLIPTGNFHIEFFNRRKHSVLVDSCAIEASGTMELPTPWSTSELRKVRTSQSGDVVFCACVGNKQRRIERRAVRSWSIVEYAPETGPFRVQNTGPITITPSALSGDVTLTASKALFKSGHVGALFRHASVGQNVSVAITAEDTFSDPIRVTGVGEGRRFGITITGTFTATVTVQYSVNEPGSWVDLTTTYTVATSTTYLDEQDNQVIYYRIGVKTGNFTSGTVNASLNYSAGSIQGIARITAYTSATSVSAVVLQDFGAATASSDWWEGEWSDYRGYPSAVALFEGRLWWFGLDSVKGSISDAFADFDDTFEGDAGPISRSIGEGPIDTIHWALALGRLLIGTALNSSNVVPVKIDGNDVLAARSSSFDEPLTPTNFNLKNASARGAFVDRSGQRVFELAYDFETNDYLPDELTLLVPDLNSAGIVHMFVQMKPDVRIHAIRADGTAGVLVYDRVENVLCWLEVETTGQIEDGMALPGSDEDQVYYQVKRTINSAEVRYWEKWALESNCTGRPVGHVADSHLIYNGAETTSISGLSHLEGETVVVWGWNTVTPFTGQDGNAVGRDLGVFTVQNGKISGLGNAVTDACIGLTYTADFESVKIGDLNIRKKIHEFGLSLLNTHYQGIKVGRSFTKLHELSKREQIRTTSEHHVWDEMDTKLHPFQGDWDTDSRLCLRATAPRPCTVRAATIAYES